MSIFFPSGNIDPKKIPVIGPNNTIAQIKKSQPSGIAPTGAIISEPINVFNPANAQVLIQYSEPDEATILLEKIKDDPAAIEGTSYANNIDFVIRAFSYLLENLEDKLAPLSLVKYIGYDAAVKLTEIAPHYTSFVADDIARRLITEHDPHLLSFAQDTIAVEFIIKDHKLLAFARNDLAIDIIQTAPQWLDETLEYCKTNKQELAYVNEAVALKMLNLPPAQISIAEYFPHMSEDFALKVCRQSPILIFYVNEDLLEKRDFVLAILEAYQAKPRYYTDDNGQQERNDLLSHVGEVSARHVKNGQPANPLLSDCEFLRQCEQLGDTFATMLLRELDAAKQ